MELEINHSLLLIVIFQFLLMGIFLLTNHKGKRASNLLLGILCVVISVSFSEMLFSSQENYHKLGLLSYLDLPWMLLIGPLIYGYTRSVIFRNFRLHWHQLLHYLPFLLLTILVSINYYNIPEASRAEVIQKIYTHQLTFKQAMIVIPFYVHLIIYIVLCFLHLRQYRKVVSQDFSNLRPVSLDWLVFLIRSFLAITVISLMLSVFPYTKWDYLTTYVLVADIGLAFLIINQIVFKALKHPSLFSGIEEAPAVPKYVKSTLSEADKVTTTKELLEYMESQRPYLDPDLSFEGLAHMLSSKKRILSQVINEKMESSFFEFINQYRVGHSKLLMEQLPDKTISEILYQSGFNSKSSFNSAFKKATHMTPTEYRKSLQKKGS